ncbi:MAG TPA: exo-alpha-sialidase [Planctomycetaceae bacterium]|jgi:sialidase-1|nr:exo-alpha-sialidase [Planctomycetaceae bacterium]
MRGWWGIVVVIAALRVHDTGADDRSRIDSVPFLGGTAGYAVYRTPALVVSSQGTVLAFCGGRVNDHKDEGDIDIVLRRSVDGGKTWGPLQVLANDGLHPCKCVCPVVLDSGRVLALYVWNKSILSKEDRTTREVYEIHSDDDGLTWSQPRNITAMVSQPDWGWSGTGPCHAIVKQREPHRGRIVVPGRHAVGKGMVSHILYSDDQGATWHLGGSLDRKRSTECTVVELSTGELMLNSRNQRGDEEHRVVAISQDGGATFGPARIDRALVEPRGCQASLLFYGLDPQTGRGQVLFSNPADATQRSNGTLRLSVDDGQTWTRSFRYAPRPAPYFTGYSDIARLPNGDIAVLYERGEFGPSQRKAERYGEIGLTTVSFHELKAAP